MLRMSCHVQAWNSGAWEFAARLGGPLLKVMTPELDPIVRLLALHPQTQIVVRKYFSLEEQADRLNRGYDGGVQVANEVMIHYADIINWCNAHGVTVWAEALNEPPAQTFEDIDRLVTFTDGFIDQMTPARPVIFCFSVGQPDDYVPRREKWERLWPVMRRAKAKGAAWEYHGYGWPDVRNEFMYYALRPRLTKAEGMPEDLHDMSLIYGECGLDRGITGGAPPGIRAEDWAGWTNAGITPDQYAEQLVWLDAEYDKDNVLGGTIFTVGGWWPSFDVSHVPEIADALREAAASHPAPPIPEPETPPMTNEWTRAAIIALIIAYADAAGVPRRLSLAGVIAESGIAADAERFGAETGYAKNLITAIETYGIDTVGDWDGTSTPMTGRQAWDALMRRTWPDVSFGPLQITVQHSSFFGDGSSSYENVMGFRARAFDPQATLEWAGPRFKQYYNPGESDAEWKALNRWNYPAGNGRPWRGNGDNYRRALAQADAILAALPPQEDDVSKEQLAAIKTQLDAQWGTLDELERAIAAMRRSIAAIKDAAGI